MKEIDNRSRRGTTANHLTVSAMVVVCSVQETVCLNILIPSNLPRYMQLKINIDDITICAI